MRRAQPSCGTWKTSWEDLVREEIELLFLVHGFFLPFITAKFEPFLKTYYDKFKYVSIDSHQFREFFLDYFKDEKAVEKVDWQTWFKEPGMPKFKPNYDDDKLAKGCQELKGRWVSWNGEGEAPFASDDVASFTGGQIEEFLSLLLLEEPLSHAKLEKLGELYKLKETKNAEIRMRWIRLGLRGKWMGVVDNAVDMVTTQGRMKFLRPIYRDMYAWEDTRETALKTFAKNRDSMMKVSVQGLEKDLKITT